MAYDLDAVRAQFPALSITDDGKRRIYFDNPAGTQVPQSVADAMARCLLEANESVAVLLLELQILKQVSLLDFVDWEPPL